MQDTVAYFPTEVQHTRSKPQLATQAPLSPSRQQFVSYVSNLDIKIGRGLQNQNSQLALRRKQMMDQIRAVKNEQSLLLEDIKKRENYFEQHYYKYLKGDV